MIAGADFDGFGTNALSEYCKHAQKCQWEDVQPKSAPGEQYNEVREGNNDRRGKEK